MSFKISSLALAVATLSTISAAHAAGLDRSTQPSWAFTEQGTFAYVEGITIDPKVSGKDNTKVSSDEANFVAGHDVSDMANKYSFINYGAKSDVNDTISLGVFFDQPWGADVEFTGDNNFVAQNANTTISNLTGGTIPSVTAANQTLTTLKTGIAGLTAQANATTDLTAKAALQAQITTLTKKATDLGSALLVSSTNQSNVGQGTNVSISSQNFTGMMGVKLGEKKNIQIYGGPALQKMSGALHLRGAAYSGASGYDAHVKSDTAVGWMAGLAYTKPEIALKAALTYRSAIKHKTDISEHLPLASVLSASNPTATGGNIPVDETSSITVETPQSVNLDFQTGLNPTTLLTAKARWVPWSDFSITPRNYNRLSKLRVKDGTPLVSYDKDSWSAELGLGKKLSPQLALQGSVGYDTGAGNPVTSLGPTEGYWNVGLGAKYNLTPEWAISGGAKYLMFGDAKAKLPDGSIVGDFKDNDGWVYGLRLSYQKK